MRRGIWSVMSALVVATAALSPLVLDGGAAAAAPVPCVQEFEGYADGAEVFLGDERRLPINVRPPSGVPRDVRVVDVDVSVDAELARGTRLWLATNTGRGLLTEIQVSDPIEQRVVWTRFDDEAPDWAPPAAQSGHFRPRDPLAWFDGQPLADPGWALLVDRQIGSRTERTRVLRVQLTITLSWCDTDGDGVEQRADNCPAAVNADQADADADGTGNACDQTPYPPAPSPTVTPTSATPTATTTFAPSQPTATPAPGCGDQTCRYDRAVDIRRGTRHRLTGTVTSPALGCRAGVEVAVWRVRPGADRPVRVLRSRDDAGFRTRVRRAGRYYVTVGSPAEPLCAHDRSTSVRFRR